MRVLIYRETPEAIEIMERESGAGNHASLRNPDPYFFNANRPEPCGKVVTWDGFIARAYEGRAEVEHVGESVKSVPSEIVVAPKRKKK